jgi:hypothetical protein
MISNNEIGFNPEVEINYFLKLFKEIRKKYRGKNFEDQNEKFNFVNDYWVVLFCISSLWK